MNELQKSPTLAPQSNHYEKFDCMKRQFLLSLFVSGILVASAQSSSQREIAIIPEPVSLQKKAGSFTLPQAITIEAPAGAELQSTVSFLKSRLSVPTGYKVTVGNTAPTAAIRLQLTKMTDATLGKEGYRLSVTPKAVVITANGPAGLFYGAQTFVQLFPKEIESTKPVSNFRWEAPAVEITDYPRFGWRGLMFDVSRHFFTKEEVKEYIDQMVRYKYNLLHWHLTDDEGWRIEIKSLPNLTKKGAWNVKKVGYFGTFSPPSPDEPRDYGGFYTQDDIREVVQYAKERFVNILPEVDVPGHSLAAIVSYPELSCTPGADKYVVRSGEPIMDWSHGAPPIAMVDNTLCPANEKVYEFMDKVVTELAQLFPFEYIHLGGDEAPHNFWEKNEQVKALMQKEGLKTIPQVQEYFTRRVEKIVASKGKKLIGWDEILEGGDLPKTTAVMSWRGMKWGTDAAKKGHEVVMSPTTYAYIDYMQGDPIVEPRIYASLRLSKAYQFDPLPEGVDKKFIKGGQANLWTEQVYNMRHAQYMTWPRGWAIAESLWSPKEKKNWKDFFGRVENHFGRYEAAKIKYAPSVYDPIFTATKSGDGQLKIALKTEAEGLDIYYTFDNTFPDNYSPKYKDPLTPPKDAVQLKVVTYKGDQPVGRIIAMPIEELQKRADSKRNFE
jgi:hexosaminidase